MIVNPPFSKGTKEKLQDLENGDMTVMLDLSNIEEPGNYTVPVLINLPEGYSVFDEYTVSLHIYEGNLEYSEMTSQNQNSGTEEGSTTKSNKNNTGKSEE